MDDWWKILELGGVWAAAAATFYAARVALRVAGKSDRINLDLSLSQLVRVVPGSGNPPVPLFQFKVTNLGRRKTQITSIYWTMSPLTKIHLWQNLAGLGNSKLPTELDDGESAIYSFDELQIYGNWYANLGNGILGNKSRLRANLDLWFLKCWVSTSVGDKFSKRPSSDLRKKLRSEWKKSNAEIIGEPKSE